MTRKAMPATTKAVAAETRRVLGIVRKLGNKKPSPMGAIQGGKDHYHDGWTDACQSIEELIMDGRKA